MIDILNFEWTHFFIFSKTLLVSSLSLQKGSVDGVCGRGLETGDWYTQEFDSLGSET